MNFIFCKLKKPQKTWISFFASLKTSKNMNFIFYKLKKPQKTWISWRQLSSAFQSAALPQSGRPRRVKWAHEWYIQKRSKVVWRKAVLFQTPRDYQALRHSMVREKSWMAIWSRRFAIGQWMQCLRGWRCRFPKSGISTLGDWRKWRQCRPPPRSGG